ncbi:L,D-transpeptidase [Oceaniglobus ichthyenteri]|uniref:L,D-transpeptidase n=1 Tax=Oceaniglobus ichthyenteri TaxID=2136177 RepID=UPI000D3A3718|nr:L,D-transpeptidase [Oceaniglobus ichthyenteri]
MLTRRSFVALAGAGGLAACVRPPAEPVTRAVVAPPAPTYPPVPDFYAAITTEPFPIPAIPDGALAPHLWRQEVENPFPTRARGTIVIDPDAALLHFVESPQKAMRYGVSVGAAGFAWEGAARLQFCREWPVWKVPAAMIKRQPELAPYSVANGGMQPGPGNPMGARALYLFKDGKDTLYRVHGSASPQELGKAVSSGCIRMLNQDVIDLHQRAVHGASVIVLPSMKQGGTDLIY